MVESGRRSGSAGSGPSSGRRVPERAAQDGSGAGRGAEGTASAPGEAGPNPVTRGKRPAAGTRRQVPWLLIGAVTVVVLLAVGVIGFALMREGEVSAWRPSDDNRDPSLAIPGIVTGQYAAQQHVTAAAAGGLRPLAPVRRPARRLLGGLHRRRLPDPGAHREHGPLPRARRGVDRLRPGARAPGPALQALAGEVQGQDYTMMSPYPGLDQPIALQSWGHELKLSDPNDPRIDQFI